MKQRITVEQVMEFTGNQKDKIELIYGIAYKKTPKEFYDKLPEFCKRDKAQTYDEWFENYIVKRLGEIYYEISVKLNVGRLIEILQSFKDKDIFRYNDIDISDSNLCDALWQAVKQVL
jgi:hypothetical protein